MKSKSTFLGHSVYACLCDGILFQLMTPIIILTHNIYTVGGNAARESSPLAEINNMSVWAAFHCRVFPRARTHGKVYILLTYTNEITNGIKG